MMDIHRFYLIFHTFYFLIFCTCIYDFLIDNIFLLFFSLYKNSVYLLDAFYFLKANHIFCYCFSHSQNSSFFLSIICTFFGTHFIFPFIKNLLYSVSLFSNNFLIFIRSTFTFAFNSFYSIPEDFHLILFCQRLQTPYIPSVEINTYINRKKNAVTIIFVQSFSQKCVYEMI